tara:strand:- start:128 stop:562 length:435 start_codon:yes stop_codon:yes gene_type:complete
MSKRVLLGKIDGSDYGLLVSRAGVDVTNANADQLIFDSRQKGYGQLIFEETITVTRDGFTGSSFVDNSVTRTFSSLEIPNPIVIVYGNVFINVTSTTTTQVTFKLPYFYKGFLTSYPLSNIFSAVGKITPASQSVTYAIIRGPV